MHGGTQYRPKEENRGGNGEPMPGEVQWAEARFHDGAENRECNLQQVTHTSHTFCPFCSIRKVIAGAC
eukprot:5361358-Prorocentrum_lima.AAC.1